MNDVKPVWMSKTVWAALMTIIAVSLGFLGYEFTMADQILLTENVFEGIAIGTSCYTIYGRVTATKQIGGAK